MAVLCMRGFDKYGTFASDYAGDFYSVGTDVTHGLGTGRTGSGKCLTVAPYSGGDSTRSLLRSNGVTVSGSTIIVGMGLYFTTALGVTIFRILNASGAEVIKVSRTVGGDITVTNNATVLLTSSTTFSLTTWFHLGVKIVLGDTTAGSVALQINGAAAGSVSSVDTIYSAATNPLYIDWPLSGTTGSTATFWLDDLVICDGSGSFFNDFVGDRVVVGLPVTSDATPNDWTCSAGTDHYALVDEIGPSATDYLSTSTDAAQELFGHTALAVGFSGATNIAVQVSVQAFKSAAGDRTLKLISKPSGGTISSPSAKALGTSASYVTEIIETNPVTGDPFTQSEVDALLIGVEAA